VAAKQEARLPDHQEGLHHRDLAHLQLVGLAALEPVQQVRARQQQGWGLQW